MSDLPSIPQAHGAPTSQALSPHSFNSLGPMLSGTGSSSAWPLTNLIIYIPVRIFRPVTVYQSIVGCGSTGGGSFHNGLYDRFGNRLLTTGSVNRSASGEVITDVTDTFLLPGLYYLALQVNGTNNMIMSSTETARAWRAMGCREEAAAGAGLPTTATWVTITRTNIPYGFGFWLRSE